MGQRLRDLGDLARELISDAQTFLRPVVAHMASVRRSNDKKLPPLSPQDEEEILRQLLERGPATVVSFGRPSDPWSQRMQEPCRCQEHRGSTPDTLPR